MATVKFENVNKIYGGKNQAVFDFNLEVKDKEFVALVGPSGCGKSTTLRMLAGLEEITTGTIKIDDLVVNDILPKDRDIAMVFQTYALYPHMSVYDNMAFGLKIRKLPKQLIDARVKEAAEILGLTEYLKRKPKALSGGQRQRVALGRCIVRTPKVFLMDEPLSNLDAKLRVQMRSEITRIHQAVNATTIYVTHDQTEAMTMADRIVVMKDGFIQQIGSPSEIYTKPTNVFVAGFIGSPAMNFIKGTIKAGKFVQVDENLPEKKLLKVNLNKEQKDALKNYVGKEVILGVRPENIYLKGDLANTEPVCDFDLEAEIVELLGSRYIVYGKNGNSNIVLEMNTNNPIKPKDVKTFTLSGNNLHFFDGVTQQRI